MAATPLPQEILRAWQRIEFFQPYTPEKKDKSLFIKLNQLKTRGDILLPWHSEDLRREYEIPDKAHYIVPPKEGDLLFSYETRLGEAALMPAGVRACLGRRMGLLRFNKAKVMPEYALYAYLSPAFQQTIKANTLTGATVDRLSISEFPNFPIRIPPLEEQKKVADLLGSIDKKIALNNSVNTELEAMAKTLYDYWFVQFDFPDANGKPYKTSGGKMEYNATLKREIPVGWNDSILGEFIELERGVTYSKEDVKIQDNKDTIGVLRDLLPVD